MTTSRRLPSWLKAKMPGSKNYIEVKNLINKNSLNTVCADAKCPNIGECWDNRTATFMILGDICTRACRYCAVKSGKPIGLDIKEPLRVSDAVKKLMKREGLALRWHLMQEGVEEKEIEKEIKKWELNREDILATRETKEAEKLAKKKEKSQPSEAAPEAEQPAEEESSDDAGEEE